LAGGHCGQAGQAGAAGAAGHDKASGLGGCCGACAHEASRIAAIPAKSERVMWVVVLEVVVALGLAAFIVWFTWPKKPPQDKP
jgi:hypothetical protein